MDWWPRHHCAEAVSLESAHDIDDDNALVGAWGDDDAGTTCGAAYAFNRTEATWSQTAKLLAEDGSAGDIMGNPAVSEQRVFAGAMGSDVLATDAGAAYAFSPGTDDTLPGKGSPHKQGALTGVAR